MKLTLDVTEDVIRQAGRLARLHATSVSAMFERLVRSMSLRKSAPRALGPLTRKASGIIAMPKGRTERRLLERARMEKHGIRR